MKSNGVILYKGASQLDGKPIIVVATGLNKASANSKTGDMIQTWIIREDIAPHEAIKSGDDVSICGDCPLRGTKGKERTCYVATHQAPLSVYKAYHRGNYPEATHADLIALAKGRMVRIGSYGDPAAVPVQVWAMFTQGTKGWTGYTHQWKTADDLKPYTMASCETEQDREQATSQGWRTFRVKTEDMPMLTNEVECPATTVGLSCEACGACKGTTGQAKGTIVINVHGNGSKHLKAA